MAIVTKKDKFFEVLRSIFVGAKIEGDSGYVNLMKIKSTYYNEFKDQLLQDIEAKLNEVGKNFEEELYNKLYTFFKKYFSESGSIYFSYTPLREKVYERIYRDDKDVVLFWKTHMLYYVKTERLFKNMEIEDDGITYFFDVSELQHKKSNEKKDLVFELLKAKNTDKRRIHFLVKYSANGSKTKYEEIHKKIKKEDTFGSLTIKQLEKMIGIFIRQSEIDYFINKDAKGFLREQFSLYIKGYLIDDETMFELDRLNQLKTLQSIAFNIIDLVSQFEDELVKIWNKPKFAHSSNYVITLDKIAERNFELLEKILKHQGIKIQIIEWIELGIVDESFDIKTITKNKILISKWQYLPLDTKYVKDYEIDILALFTDLDNDLDGWLIHSENYQFLNTYKNKYNKKVKYIHIDPPYNAKHSEIFYVNNYKSSSWLSFMNDRINVSLSYLKDASCIMCHIDENEYENLFKLFYTYLLDNKGTIIWDKRNPMGGSNQIANQHEYIICKTKGNIKLISKKENGKLILNRAKDFIKENNGIIDEKVRNNFRKWVKEQDYLSGGEASFCEIEDDGRVFQTMHMGAPEQRKDKKFFIPLIHPITKKPCPVPASGWSNTPEFMKELLDNNELFFGKDESTQPRRKSFLTDKLIGELSSIIYNGSKGKRDSEALGFDFQYNHPVSLYVTLLYSVDANSEDIILDYFGGSGTTAHSVISLNKQDNKRRKYLMIEAGDHFYNALLPRIKKLSFSGKWKKGKALDSDGYSNFFKYFELEQYEETLTKIVYKDTNALPNQDIYHQYLFLKDIKLVNDIVKLDDKSNSIKVDLAQIHTAIDIPETLSHLTGKFIKQILKDKVVFVDGSIIDLNNIDYKIVKPLIWW